MVESADTSDLKSDVERRVGSSPAMSTILQGGATEAQRAHNPPAMGSTPINH